MSVWSWIIQTTTETIVRPVSTLCSSNIQRVFTPPGLCQHSGVSCQHLPVFCGRRWRFPRRLTRHRGRWWALRMLAVSAACAPRRGSAGATRSCTHRCPCSPRTSAQGAAVRCDNQGHCIACFSVRQPERLLAGLLTDGKFRGETQTHTRHYYY